MRGRGTRHFCSAHNSRRLISIKRPRDLIRSTPSPPAEPPPRYAYTLYTLLCILCCCVYAVYIYYMIYDRLIMTHMASTKTPPLPPPNYRLGARIRRQRALLCFDLFSGLMEILDTTAPPPPSPRGWWPVN